MIVIRTPRLALRTWRPSDAGALYAMNQDPRVIEHLPGPMGMQQVTDFMTGQNTLHEVTGSCYLAATLATDGTLVGFVGLKRHDAGLPFAPCTDIGWARNTGARDTHAKPPRPACATASTSLDWTRSCPSRSRTTCVRAP